MNDLIQRASIEQARASDPMASVFVSANAGTGKTKLLTDRVLRLLLSGAEADGILCVTYTRAAAAEMRNRIYARLARWAVISTADLTKDLQAMGIVAPSQGNIRLARMLFAKILDNDNGPRVETVHSFCQSILRRFPIEAGIAPNAKLADDAEQDRLKSIAKVAVMNSLDPAIQIAVATIANQSSEGQATEILTEFLRRVPALDDIDTLSRLQAHFRDDLDMPEADFVTQHIAEALAKIDDEALRAVAVALQNAKTETQRDRGAAFFAWLALDDEMRIARLNLLVDALFTTKGPRADRNLSNADIRAEYPPIVDVQRAVIDILTPILHMMATDRCRELTTALYIFGAAFQRHYQSLKESRGLLDYDDLIAVTNRLLARSEAAQWVAWKLDNGIGHVLVDEAQDTSPAQWTLLLRLVESFFDGSDMPVAASSIASDTADMDIAPRSVFAVGDFKQSIYSFQGADPKVLGENRTLLRNKAMAAEIDFRALSLSVSFRSTAPILGLVNDLIPDLDGIEDFVSHDLARRHKGGFVEVWPIIDAPVDEEKTEGFTPANIASMQGASAVAASHLARTLKSWIGKRPLPSSDNDHMPRKIMAGDILILLRKRDVFFEQVLVALQEQGVAVAGADRMRLVDQIEIQDLLALGDVALLPDDDLQLAALLKSPLFGISEAQLFDLAHDRGSHSLFRQLMRYLGSNDPLGRIADRLEEWCRLVDGGSVFSFFSKVLVDGGRDKFRARLGSSVDEALDHFLAVAQSYGESGGVSLTAFLAAVRAGGGDVKRDMDAGNVDEVRVMTIHGAKGLEAPIVILPDMLRHSVPHSPLITGEDQRFIYWEAGSHLRPPFLETARQKASDLRAEEDNRLLYVALTRARDGLVIGGWEKRNSRWLENSPYSRIKAYFTEHKDVVEDVDGVLRHIAKTVSEADSVFPSMPDDDAAMRVPDIASEPADTSWLHHPAPDLPPDARPLRPSEPANLYAPHPLGFGVTDSRTQAMALTRGRLAHRLFEMLPTVPQDQRNTVADRMIATVDMLSPAQGAQLKNEVFTILNDPRFGNLFTPDALAEVPVTGMVRDRGVSGQIDRLFVGDDSVIIADFKTGIANEDSPPETYQRQMALYAALIGEIFPNKPIVCWLIWTETARLQEITASMRALALARIFGDIKTVYNSFT
ncbi:UvrD/REP helicase [Candidatus Puniceispirillum marinum IMCC1322]|uniref:DNA 3'-5' helicase n=2 Tax=Candidatus Puniceispirillum TaxID=767891 RepID=D5BTA7_PUNMI|nr:UvrD/REP helicase [Candidatus Puniceispirillum marinum IMCC1322]